MKLPERQETYELVVPANYGATMINFPDIPELRSDTTQDTVIHAAEVFPSDAVPSSYSGNPVSTLAQIQNAFITFYVLGYQQIYRVPLIRLLQTRNEGSSYYYSGIPWENLPIRVDWTKSYIQFAVPPSDNDQFVFLFNFSYAWLPVGAYANYVANRKAQLMQGIIPLV